MPELSALVSARLCHDLISPMGAIGNGLELLQMSEGRGAAELDLVNDSLANALGKLRFYRVAFGPADPQGRLSFEEAQQVSDAVFQGRFSVRWRARETSMARPLAKLSYLAILCFEKSLPTGGVAEVNVADNKVTLSVEGSRVAAPAELWAHVTEGTEDVAFKSDNVQFALLRLAMIAGGQMARTEFSEVGGTLWLSEPG